MHAPSLDRADRRRRTDIGAAPLEHAHRHGRQRLVDLRQDASARLEQPEAHLLTTDARIEAQHVIGKRGQLAQQLDADEAAADDDDRQTAPARRRVGRRIGAFELFDQVIPQHERIRHRLERECVSTSQESAARWWTRRERRRDGRRQFVGAALGGNGANDPALDINAFDRGLDEAGPSERGADRLRAVAKLQPAGARFEQQRREHEEVLAADERHFDVWRASATVAPGDARPSRHRILHPARRCACPSGRLT